ncbi:hypothetical protein D8796_07300 [Streptococcus cristatus]|uniref:Uncharacterized protein n=1 Tax=Streptococcus cristatus TaxID=45634 RepID=A0A428GTG6_STRCR|nr:hypothetical protein D8795_06655 [Streptococcus cristatus]RSJ79127.1 hypothetical protein D8796_07300 [Streptococcus cristatus]RSJ84988.1 hypothetical protein D8793_08175 [Streptococcus cristatus]RSJ85494.1 hypothetical protein D8794_06805 [Streptococcus cristatus]
MRKKIIVVLAILFVLVSGGGYCMTKWIEHQNSPYNVSDVLDDKEVKLYKRGFRLLEEQLSTYIKEHYSGISKIEFSPIFVQGGDGQTMFGASIIAAITDSNGNKTYLGKKIGDTTYAAYGDSWDLLLGFDGATGEEAIDLRVDENTTVEVSNHKHLPEFAKLSSLPKLDKNIEVLIQNGQLKGVKKSESGSPKAKIEYNIEIRRGNYSEWE